MRNDPRGPLQHVVRVHPDRVATEDEGIMGTVTPVELDCGHIALCNPTFDYSKTIHMRCFECGPHGKEARSAAGRKGNDDDTQ